MGGVTDSTASDIENGAVPLKAEYLPAIADLLGVQVWELFVDYDAKEIGPLSDQEKAHLLNLRQISDKADLTVVQGIVKRLSQKS